MTDEVCEVLGTDTVFGVVFQSTALCPLKLSENVIWEVRGESLIDTVLYLKIIGFEKKMEVVIFSE